MIFKETPLKNAYLIEIQRLEDERGFFVRSWCQREFEEHGLNPRLVQCNISFNKKKGTLRGMHYQAAPMKKQSWCSAWQGPSMMSSSTCGPTRRHISSISA